jgi:ribosomal protein L37AE/L43A
MTEQELPQEQQNMVSEHKCPCCSGVLHIYAWGGLACNLVCEVCGKKFWEGWYGFATRLHKSAIKESNL